MSEKELTAVEWFYDQMPKKIQPHYKKQLEHAKVMEEQQKVEFAFRAYSEKLSTSKDFIEIVNSMRTFKTK